MVNAKSAVLATLTVALHVNAETRRMTMVDQINETHHFLVYFAPIGLALMILIFAIVSWKNNFKEDK